MSTGPVEVLDGVVKGIIFGAYDFVRLTIYGFLFPFFRRTRKVWPRIVQIDKRFSSLTYMVIWICIVTAGYSGTASDLALSYLGLRKEPGIKIPELFAAVLLTTMFSDIAVRVSAAMIRNHIRRTLYEPLARIAVANIFLGIFILILLAEVYVLRHPGMWSFFGSPFFVMYALASFREWHSYLYLFPFAAALAVIVTKSFAIRDWRLKLFVGLPVMLIAPVLAVSATVWIFLLMDQVGNFLSPPIELAISQQSMRCSSAAGRVSASGLLKLSGADTLAIDQSLFGILLGRDEAGTSFSDNEVTMPISVLPNDAIGSEPVTQQIRARTHLSALEEDSDTSTVKAFRYLGRGYENRPPIVLTAGRLTAVTITAAFKSLPGGPTSSPQGGTFDCELVLLGKPYDTTTPVLSGDPPASPN